MALVGMVLPREKPIPEPDFKLEGWIPDPLRLEPLHREDLERARKYPLAQAQKPVIDAFEALGLVEFETGGRMGEPAYEKATEAAIDAMGHYWFQVGEDGYRYTLNNFVAFVVAEEAWQDQEVDISFSIQAGDGAEWFGETRRLTLRKIADAD